MYKFALFLTLAMLFGTHSYAVTCSVECSKGAYYTHAILEDPTSKSVGEREDFKQYCKSIEPKTTVHGLSPSSCEKSTWTWICQGQGKVLSGWAHGEGANLYEARQAARENCSASLPNYGSACVVGDYWGGPGPKFENFKCD